MRAKRSAVRPVDPRVRRWACSSPSAPARSALPNAGGRAASTKSASATASASTWSSAASSWSRWAKAARENSAVPGSARTASSGPGSRSTTPAASTVPVRSSTLDRCPSPIARRVMTNLIAPGGRPDWSGCGTIDGLRSPAPSTVSSWVKQAPMSRRTGAETPSGSTSRCSSIAAWRSQAPSRSRWRWAKAAVSAASSRATSRSDSVRTRLSTSEDRDRPLADGSWPGRNRAVTTRVASGRRTRAVRWTQLGSGVMTRRRGRARARAERSRAKRGLTPHPGSG